MRIASPETSLKTINDRLNLVEHLIHSPNLLNDIQYQLRRSYDSQRLVQKMCMGRGDADDLLALARTIEATKDISKLLCAQKPVKEETRVVLQNLVARLDIPIKL